MLVPWVELKFVPVIVTDEPGAPEGADKLVMAGAGVALKETALLGAPPTVTIKFPGVAPVGTSTVSVLAVQATVVVAAVPLNVTVLVPCAPPKPDPVMVTGPD